MDRLRGRVAVVTGASSGIGEATAIAFAEAGARVALAARRADRLATLAERITAVGGEALAVPTDVTDDEQVAALFETVLAEWGQVDVLINNAGVTHEAPADSFPMAEWRRVIDTNLTAVFACSREAFAIMKRQRRGRIINIGSLSARVPRANSAAYTASKFGLDGLTRSMAVDGREHGVAVSIFHAGMVYSELAPGMAAAPPEKMSDPADTAAILVHMASVPDHLNFIEGMMLPLAVPFLGRG